MARPSRPTRKELAALTVGDPASIQPGDFVVAATAGHPQDFQLIARVEESRAGANGRELLIRYVRPDGSWSNNRAWCVTSLVQGPVPVDKAQALLDQHSVEAPPKFTTSERPLPQAVLPKEPARPAMPPGPFAAQFGQLTYPGQFRRYQTLALDAFEVARAGGRRRSYLVLPPGAGKTLLGLEIARRLGSTTVALGPNTAIQEQWIRQWREYQPQSVEASGDADLHAPVTALTYQAICNLDAHNPALEEQLAELEHEVEGAHPAVADQNPHHAAEAARLRGSARKQIAQSGDSQKLLALLHPNGRRLLERIQAAGQVTVILDECHHLLEMWGYLLQALVSELGDRVFLVGLTATPPSEMGPREAVLYQELFGHADFEVPTPAVVKEGNLAPYQELSYLTTPLQQELDYIAEEKTRFEELITELSRPDLGTVSFLDWLRTRVFERQAADGVQVSWARFEADHPDLALAALRYCFATKTPPPEGARMAEADRREPAADDWVALISDYCTGHLRESADPKDLEVWEMIRRALPSVGYALTRQGIRSYVSPVDRVLLLSASKGVAAIDILDAEAQALGGRLRALVLCDYEVAGSELVGNLRGVLDPQAGSAALLLKTLLGDQTAAGLDPILVTGQTVACSRATAAALVSWWGGQLTTADLFKDATGGWEAVVEIKPAGSAWSPSVYLPRITAYFEEGRSRCLLGTRGLLGEGWDAKSVNVLIDLTGVTTATSMHQMRGRSLRLDPDLPHKVADNWDVICVARDHPKGSADYDRFVRKHRNYYSITSSGEIESGVSHVDARLSPYGPAPDDVARQVSVDALQRPDARDRIYDLWAIGQPYRNAPVQTVRIRAARPLGISSGRLPASAPGASGRPRLVGTRVLVGLAGGSAVWIWGAAAGEAAVGLGAGAVLAGGGIGWAAASLSAHARRLGPSSALEDLAAAVADALTTTTLIDPKLGASAVRMAPQADGYYRCYLEGASLQDSALFATSLDELLAPIDSPRYVIPRYVAVPPRSPLDALRLLLARFAGPRVGANVVYHAVPSALAANKQLVKAFETAWNRRVSAGRALFHDDPRAQAVMQLQRGEDPFALTTQMRTLWE